MKKLFETDKSIFGVGGDADTFEWYDRKNNKVHAIDRQGQEIPEYQRPPLVFDEYEELEGKYPDDPTAIGAIAEGMYPYSTHPMTHDPDGDYGIIGIKDREGNIVAAEQYEQVDYYFNGLCSVKKKDAGWGCIDKEGNEVISFQYDEPVRFNKYGVAAANDYLMDKEERKLEGTDLNFCEGYYEDDRYFLISMDSEEELAEIDECGYSETLTVDVYDTKYRNYVVREVPDSTLMIFEGEKDLEPEVIKAAVALLTDYEEVTVCKSGKIIAKKGTGCSVFDYYMEE